MEELAKEQEVRLQLENAIREGNDAGFELAKNLHALAGSTAPAVLPVGDPGAVVVLCQDALPHLRLALVSSEERIRQVEAELEREQKAKDHLTVTVGEREADLAAERSRLEASERELAQGKMLNDQMRSEAEITNQNLSATSKRAKDAEEEVTQERDMRRVVSKELDDVREEHARTVVQLSQEKKNREQVDDALLAISHSVLQLGSGLHAIVDSAPHAPPDDGKAESAIAFCQAALAPLRAAHQEHAVTKARAEQAETAAAYERQSRDEMEAKMRALGEAREASEDLDESRASYEASLALAEADAVRERYAREQLEATQREAVQTSLRLGERLYALAGVVPDKTPPEGLGGAILFCESALGPLDDKCGHLATALARADKNESEATRERELRLALEEKQADGKKSESELAREREDFQLLKKKLESDLAREKGEKETQTKRLEAELVRIREERQIEVKNLTSELTKVQEERQAQSKKQEAEVARLREESRALTNQLESNSSRSQEVGQAEVLKLEAEVRREREMRLNAETMLARGSNSRVPALPVTRQGGGQASAEDAGSFAPLSFSSSSARPHMQQQTCVDRRGCVLQ